MSFNVLEREVLESLQPDAVQAYLRARGWEDVGTEGPAARVYAKPEIGTSSEVLVPTKPSAPDYGQFTSILIDRVAQFEKMGRDALVHDLSLAGFDVLRVRIVNAEDGSLDLEKVVIVVKEARAALVAAAAATAARAPRKNYAGRQHESVSAFVDQVRVGQTERGSFVIPLLSPYAFDLSENAPLPGQWFARRVMRKLTVGLGAVDRVLGSSDGSAVDGFQEATHQGVSANLCGALGRLAQAVGDIELGVRWASAAPDKAVQPLRLAGASAPTLLRAAARLMEADPPPAEPLVGFITQLDDKPSSAAAGQLSSATLETWIDGKLRNVRCLFSDAHRSDFSIAWTDRRPILVDGPREREAKRLVMRVNEALLAAVEEDEETS